MNRKRNGWRRAVAHGALCAVLVLAACGSGGGGETATLPLLASDAGVYLPAGSATKHFRGVDARVNRLWPAEGYANTGT